MPWTTAPFSACKPLEEVALFEVCYLHIAVYRRVLINQYIFFYFLAGEVMSTKTSWQTKQRYIITTLCLIYGLHQPLKNERESETSLVSQSRYLGQYFRGGSRMFLRRGCTTKEWRNWLMIGRKQTLIANTKKKVPCGISGGWVRTPCTLPLDPPLYFVLSLYSNGPTSHCEIRLASDFFYFSFFRHKER